jgi:hypothetical protein
VDGEVGYYPPLIIARAAWEPVGNPAEGGVDLDTFSARTPPVTGSRACATPRSPEGQ